MSDYNAKNYTEQGGDVTHIGGKLVFDSGAALEGSGIMPNQAAETPESDTVAKVRGSLNDLITSLKDSGVMAKDVFVITVNHDVNDTDPAHADRAYNTSKIFDTFVEDNSIFMSISCPINELKDFDGGGGWGVHKWLGIGVSAGVTPITDLYFDGVRLTQADIDEATAVGLSEGYFVLWVKAEKAFFGQSKFKLKCAGYEETEYTLRVGAPLPEDDD